MIEIDITMPIQIINILVLLVIMNAVLYRPVRNILLEREKKMASLRDEAETFNKNADLRLEEFGQKMKEARKRAKSQMESVRSAAQETASESVAKVRKEAEASKAEQMSQIQQQFAAAQKELKGQVEGFAGEMAAKVLGRAL